MHAITVLAVVAAFGLVFLSLLALCAERGFRPLAGVGRLYKPLHAVERFLLMLFVGVLVALAGTKDDDGDSTNSPPARMSAPRRICVVQPGMTISEIETNLGYRVLAVREGDEIVPPQTDAVTNTAWLLRGGRDDAFRIGMAPEPTEEDWWLNSDPQWTFPWGDSWAYGLTVFARGEFQPDARTDFFPQPFGETGVSLVPRAKWEAITDGGLESLFWHELTPSNSLVLTWQNALYGRDANSPTNFQAELFGDGSFDYRYSDRTVSYAPVFPFDWDGDGLENSVDPEPLVAGPDAHGTNVEWYNTVCSNVFVAVEGEGGLELAPRHAGVNTNAYYFVDVVAERGPAPIYFTADGPSRLGNPVVVAQAGETNRVPLLIGATYDVVSPVSVEFVSVPVQVLSREEDSATGSRRRIVWPAGCNYDCVDGSFVPDAEEQERLHGVFSWEGGCCLRLSGTTLSFDCHSCACGGCSAVLNLGFEGYVIRTPGPACGCAGFSGEDSGTPFVLTEAGGGVALGVSNDFILTSRTNGVDAAVSRSSRSVLTLAAWGGARGGTLRLEMQDLDHLRPIEGGVLPDTGERVLAPNEAYSLVVTNEGASASERIGDIRLSASFVEEGTATEVRRNAGMTVCEIGLDGVSFNHDRSACTNDAINIRLDGSTNGVYDISNGEWCKGGAVNVPACYVGGTRPVVKARFTVKPRDVTSAVLAADPTAGDFPLGRIEPRRVSFVSGSSGWVGFTTCDGTNALPVRVARDAGSWEWTVTNVMDRTLARFSVATSGPHKVYTVLAHPTLPWTAGWNDEQCAWAYALEQACGWAEGATTTNAMMAAVTSNLFYNCNFTYDTVSGGTRYWRNAKFNLSGYLSRQSLLVNCYDQAFAVTALGNLLGGDAAPVFTSAFGLINTNALIGVGLCNNPFYTGDTNSIRIVVSDAGEVGIARFSVPRTPLCDGDYVGRSAFGNHMYVYSSAGIFDACAGPVLGGWEHSRYLEEVIDHSTPSERENGYYSLDSPGSHRIISNSFKFLQIIKEDE